MFQIFLKTISPLAVELNEIMFNVKFLPEIKRLMIQDTQGLVKYSPFVNLICEIKRKNDGFLIIYSIVTSDNNSIPILSETSQSLDNIQFFHLSFIKATSILQEITYNRIPLISKFIC